MIGTCCVRLCSGHRGSGCFQSHTPVIPEGRAGFESDLLTSVTLALGYVNCFVFCLFRAVGDNGAHLNRNGLPLVSDLRLGLGIF